MNKYTSNLNCNNKNVTWLSTRDIPVTKANGFFYLLLENSSQIAKTSDKAYDYGMNLHPEYHPYRLDSQLKTFAYETRNADLRLVSVFL